MALSHLHLSLLQWPSDGHFGARMASLGMRFWSLERRSDLALLIVAELQACRVPEFRCVLMIMYPRGGRSS